MATKQDLEQAAHLGAMLAHNFPREPAYCVSKLAVELMTFAKQAQSIGIAQCNYLDTDAATKKRMNLAKRIAKCLKLRLGARHLDIEYKIGGDPRGGSCMEIMLPEHGDNWEEAIRL